MVTVLLASRNGGRWLPRTLSAFEDLIPPPGGWKLVVVDNASTDDTRQVIEAHMGRLPLEYLYQPKPGKNAALNLGLDRIEGEYVVFTDDDVVPEPDWLLQLVKAAKEAPDYDVFGGAILPLWPHEPESWIKAAVPMGPVYALTDPDWPEGECPPWRVWGPNMLVRARWFTLGHRFDESVGPDGTTTYRMGSEDSLTSRLHSAGAKCWHVPGARVRHIIRPNQLERRWILGRAFRFGRGQAFGKPIPDGAPLVFGIPRYMIRVLLVAASQGLWARIRRNRIDAFLADWRFCFHLGYAVELAGMLDRAKRARTPSTSSEPVG
jgi:hypothetical protein